MEKYYTFIDETGDPDPQNYIKEPFYSVTAVLTNDKIKNHLSEELSKIKHNFFGSKDHVLHRVKIRSLLKHRNKDLDSFVKDLKVVLNLDYFLFQVLVNQEKAYKKGWDKQHVYKQTYRILFGNITKFSIARNVRNIICTEASSVSQDFNIYESFFHFISGGISNLNITHEQVKKHLTSLNFVTKINGDAGEQLADLLSQAPILKYQSDNDLNPNLDPLNIRLLKTVEKKLTSIKLPKNCKDPIKKAIYPKIKPYKTIP
jgi:hypothetical protein